MGDPRYNNMLREMVFGKRSNAEGFIKAEPRLIDRANTPIDRDWLKSTGWKLLEGAKLWLENWGPPEDEQWRIDMIKVRMDEIRLIP
jgi:hypothetical protein